MSEDFGLLAGNAKQAQDKIKVGYLFGSACSVSIDDGEETFVTKLSVGEELVQIQPSLKTDTKMPSRKRNKGKERRAKKEAVVEAKNAWWRNWAGPIGIEGCCNHGCAAIPHPDHAVSKFMNTFFEAWASKNSAITAVKSTFEKHLEVWNDDDKHRQMTIGIFLSIGTNMIMGHRASEYNPTDAIKGIAQAVLILECYDDNDAFDCACDVARMRIHRSLPNGSGEREILKFYSKRLPCSCLKEKYKHARMNLPKIAQCWYCEKEFERESLMTCGRCKVPPYCSRECQVVNVPIHKNDSDIYVGIRKELGDRKKCTVQMKRGE